MKKNFMGRLTEPSSCVAMAVLFYMFFPEMEGTAGMEYLKEVIVSLFAGAGFFMGEKGK